MFETAWERAVDYLASHAGRWVPGWELSDAVYGGHCSRTAVPKLIQRARRFFPIESDNNLGYRIGRNSVAFAACPNCGARRVRYEGEWVCYGCPGTSAVDLEVGRAPYDPNSKQGKPWSEKELRFIVEHRDRPGWTNTKMARHLGRTESGVRGQATRMDLGRKAYQHEETETEGEG